MSRIDIFTPEYLRGSRQQGLFGGPTGEHLVLEFISARSGNTIVDFGTGLGYLLSFVEPTLEKAMLIGVDARPDLTAEAGRELVPTRPGNRLTFVTADARNSGLPSSSADVVTCCALLGHVSRPEEILVEMIRVARPDGYVTTVEGFSTNLLPQFWFDVDEQRLAADVEDQRRRLDSTADPESDYDICAKLPHLFDKYGLTDIEVAFVPLLRCRGEGFERYLVNLWMLTRGRKVESTPSGPLVDDRVP